MFVLYGLSVIINFLNWFGMHSHAFFQYFKAELEFLFFPFPA